MYKAPGVYIEEIPKFPPSIAAVETAIPAFIGYTEWAERNGESLYLKPTRIESIAEYELYFGGGPSQVVKVTLDTNNQVLKTEGTAKFYLYDSLRMFYANGGGNCYIVSLGAYPAAPDVTQLKVGIKAVEIEDEPTILVFPDAATLSATDLATLQQDALAQCNRLMDRVVICDLGRVSNTVDFKTTVANFRNNIGINYLKYGAAYGPWINANLPRSLMLRDITLVNSSSDVVELKSLTADLGIQHIIFDVQAAMKAVKALKIAGTTNWDAKFKTELDAFTIAPDYASAKALYGTLTGIILAIKDMAAALPTAAESPTFQLQEAITKYLLDLGVRLAFEKLVANQKAALFATSTNTPATALTELIASADMNLAASYLGASLTVTNATGYLNDPDADDDTDPDPNIPTSAQLADADNDEEKFEQATNANLAKAAAVESSSAIIAFYRFAQTTAAAYEKQFNDALLNAFGTYKSIVSKAAEALNIIPPSGAIAGVYASVDRDRGVWKAPANVSLNAVVGPAVKISQEQQGEYNVDVNAGKSINIIRAFTGKGTLVWGGRTLAGNDNEWRYVSVRRFFNFVEESVKKATEQFVFEPNDANTWVRVQAMIENFLNTLWRQGALQGVKPDHAFYVAVGIGKTMTALDILEGRMIIEIGMAVVRPAEFIILRFSHKMPES